MRSMTTRALFLLIAMLIACGPAVQTDQGNEVGAEVPFANGTSQQDNGPVDPTVTPFPPAPKLPIDPTHTQKPTPTTKATQHKEHKPTPNLGGGNPLLTPASPVPEIPAQPEDGIIVCYGINPFNTTIEELGYLGWCHQALVDDVVDNCSATGDSAAELNCSQKRLASVVMYALREVLVPCSAISNESDRLACGQRVNAAMSDHLRVRWQTWPEILRAVDANADVRVKKAAMADCVADRGFSRPDPDSPIHWQQHKAPDDRKALRGEPESVRDATIARLEAIDQCAVKVGLYIVQEMVWINEITRLQAEQPAKVKPLIDDGILEALNADGIASFLMPARQAK